MTSTCESSTVNVFHQILSFFQKKKKMNFFSSLDSTKFSFFGEKISQNFDSTKLEKENKRNEPCPKPLFFNSREKFSS
jgi:hypothetical protein